MIKVRKLRKQKTNWSLADTHTFYNRNYYVDDFGNFYKDGKLRIVKKDAKGSYWHALINDENKQVRFKIHQIVMQSFNYEGLVDFVSVDHIDRNRNNNNLNNLRYATRAVQYSNRENSLYKRKTIKCLNTGIIYKSCQDAELDLGLVKNTVSRVARGARESIHGYKFEYVVS